VVNAAAEEKMAPPTPAAQIVRARPFPHSRATRVRKHIPSKAH
jgi:hypothetical protein